MHAKSENGAQKNHACLVFNIALTSRILDQWEIAVGGATDYKEIEIYNLLL